MQYNTRFIYILQIIIDNEENIVQVQYGFLGHENDANCYRQIGPTEPDAPLEFPDLGSNPRSTALEESMVSITPPMWLSLF